MPTLQRNAFRFTSRGLPPETFAVVRFTGEEALSTLYRFEILLISEQEDIDLGQVLQNPATFIIKEQFTGQGDLPFHGILASFEQLHQFDRYVYYRAVLRPRVWWLTLTHRHQVFLDRTPRQILEEVLADAGLSIDLDFEVRFQKDLASFDYVCQYGESHFDFFSRWSEYCGAYYWFEQGATSERLICADTRMAHVPIPERDSLLYSPVSGLDAMGKGQVVKELTLKQSPLPARVMLRDYNDMRPSLEMRAEAQVKEGGRGEIYLWADPFRNQDEGDYLAQVRAERWRCQEQVFRGLSAIPALRPGYLFRLERHYRADFNAEYLVTAVWHEGSQEQYLTSGLGVAGVPDAEALFYRNRFECIPGAVQFRPAQVTKKPTISGFLPAVIDAATETGQYAELDDDGRYKVILPFDLSGRAGGKASTWLRMATPYAAGSSGGNYGMHFPLLKGTAVLLSFEAGDIDRPLIVGAVFNRERPNPVTSRNQFRNAIRTAAGHELVIGDERSQGFIGMHLGSGHGCLILGSQSSQGQNEE